jgi:tripartite-type tricarboxylate transporter receptor subunit TctC
MLMRRALVLLLCCIATAAAAQGYPNRPVRIVVGFAPGGGVDISARLLASKLSEYLGQQFVVENKPGAGTNIAAVDVAKSAPDGYSLFMNSPAVAINMALYAKPPYDLERDFTGVSIFSKTTNLLVVPASFEAKTAQDLVKIAKQHPGKLNYASAGQGTTQHLAAELFKLRTGTDMVHVPYKGSGPSMSALLAGEVQLSFINPVAVGGHVKAGKLRALAVTGEKRAALLPQVPTLAEAGVKNVDVYSWQAIAAPKGLPADVRKTLHAALVAALNDPAIHKKLTDVGFEVVANTPEQFATFQAAEFARWKKVIEAGRISAD